MSSIPEDIAEQVRQLEQLRAAGHIDEAWYLRTRGAIVRRHRELRRTMGTTSGADAFQSTLELSLPA